MNRCLRHVHRHVHRPRPVRTVHPIQPARAGCRIGGTRGRSRRAGAAGFTLIELLVVVVIIGLLASLVAPRLFGQIGKSKVGVTRAQIDALSQALERYQIDVGSYPTTEQGLQALVTRPDSGDKWHGPYLTKAVPPDPWDRPYHYKAPGDHGDFDLYSYGADGQAGGSGENADVTSWDSAPASGSAK